MIVHIIFIALIFLELSSSITKKKEERKKREERKERTAVFRNFKSTERIMKEIKLLR